ncbi:RluA family pseudouridine synthase [bacterium]|nr:RluA family pseudouridine synthase [bacterium]
MTEEIVRLLIPPQKKPQRLDIFLTNQLKDVSRSQVQQWIKDGNATINGNECKAKHLVQPGECIDITIPRPPLLDIIPEQIPLDIVYEDEFLLIVNKIAGMVVHPSFGHYSGTLVHALLGYCNDLSDLNDTTRPGIVHRIDKDTSGLLVVAKDNVTHRGLASQFADKTASRIYHSIVWGHFKKYKGTIDTHIRRARNDRKKFVTDSEGKRAITHYQVLEKITLASLLEIKLETGRTHQIRVHMTSIGHAVFGDQIYGGVGSKLGGLNQRNMKFARQALEIMPRQALHAKTLGFIHPHTKEFLQFDSVLPEDMTLLLTFLRIEEERRTALLCKIQG